jgi:hypothetical protein
MLAVSSLEDPDDRQANPEEAFRNRSKLVDDHDEANLHTGDDQGSPIEG